MKTKYYFEKIENVHGCSQDVHKHLFSLCSKNNVFNVFKNVVNTGTVPYITVDISIPLGVDIPQYRSSVQYVDIGCSQKSFLYSEHVNIMKNSQFYFEKMMFTEKSKKSIMFTDVFSPYKTSIMFTGNNHLRIHHEHYTLKSVITSYCQVNWQKRTPYESLVIATIAKKKSGNKDSNKKYYTLKSVITRGDICC